MINAVLRSHS